MALRDELIARARELGFALCEMGPATMAPHAVQFLEWIADGRHGEMAWMAREPERRIAPERLLEGARSILFVGLNYYQKEPARRGRIATYALGQDYHDLMLPRLHTLAAVMEERGGVQKCVVDTAPLLERDHAHRAGLGWQGKSTMLIHPEQGTWFFIGAILTTLELPYGTPHRDRCGTCTRCISACPTGAIDAPYHLDARRCIAYLTIEHKGAIPEPLRPLIGDRLYGCDDCLDACPWNRWAQTTREAAFEAKELPDLREMLDWDADEFDRNLRGSPIHRIKLERWKRNICVVLGNSGDCGDLPALERLAYHADSSPLLREHAQWAMSQIQSRGLFLVPNETALG